MQTEPDHITTQSHSQHLKMLKPLPRFVFYHSMSHSMEVQMYNRKVERQLCILALNGFQTTRNRPAARSRVPLQAARKAMSA